MVEDIMLPNQLTKSGWVSGYLEFDKSVIEVPHTNNLCGNFWAEVVPKRKIPFQTPSPMKLNIGNSNTMQPTINVSEIIDGVSYNFRIAESFLATAKWIEASAECRDQSTECVTLTPEQARAKQRENAGKYLGSVHRNSWQTWEAWDKILSQRLTELDTAKPLTVEQIGAAYKHIGLGLQ
jgi:hypothetical protein